MKKLILLLLFIPLISCSKKEGCVNGDCFNGYGTFIDKYKGTYVGDFKDGKYHGQGTFNYGVNPLGGDLDYDSRNWSSLEKESGFWENGELHGEGTRIWVKKNDHKYQAKYVGNFCMGGIDGYGTQWYHWGDYFEGLFKDCDSVTDCYFDNKLKCDGNRNSVQEGIMYKLDGTSEYGRWETNTYFTNN